MAKHNASIHLNCEGSESSALPVSIVQLPAAASGNNNNNQPTILKTEGGQTIQMIKVGNRLFQVAPASAADKNLPKNGSRKIYDDGLSDSLKVTYVKSEKVDLSNSYSSPEDDEDSEHLVDEESSEQPDGGLLNLALANNPETSSSAGTTIVQGADGRFFIPVPVLSSNLSSLPRGLMVQADDQEPVGNTHGIAEEVTMKRELRLLKNREAARECRRKKKEYVRCLENRVALLENQNKTLINELKSLKELYCQKEPRS